VRKHPHLPELQCAVKQILREMLFRLEKIRVPIIAQFPGSSNPEATETRNLGCGRGLQLGEQCPLILQRNTFTAIQILSQLSIFSDKSPLVGVGLVKAVRARVPRVSVGRLKVVTYVIVSWHQG